MNFNILRKDLLHHLDPEMELVKYIFLLLKGFLAWFIWRAFYLSFLPSFATKIRVLTGWIVEFLVPRNAVMTRALKNDSIFLPKL